MRSPDENGTEEPAVITGYHIHTGLECVQIGLAESPQEKESLNLFLYLHREVSIIIIGLHSPDAMTGKLLLCSMTLPYNQPSAPSIIAQLHCSGGGTSVTVLKT